MTIVIDEVAALDALRKTVEKYGENHRLHGNCTYTRPDEGWDSGVKYREDELPEIFPNCILGCALHNEFEVPLGTLRLLDTDGGIYDVWHTVKFYAGKVSGVLTDAGVTLTPGATDIFNVAQEVQDNGHEWGYALAKAEAYAEKLRNGEIDGTEGAGATA